MIIGYLAFLTLGIIAYFLMAKFGLPIRIVLALAIFLIPSIALTVWIVRIGDKAPPDAITIIPEQNAHKSDSVGRQ